MMLLPPVMCEEAEVDITEAVNLYKDDLPSPEQIESEVYRWRQRYISSNIEDRPQTLQHTIKSCDPVIFPNIHTLLKLSCTLPVASCACEHSASALYQLTNYMWASMGESRMSALALFHMHYSFQIDVNEVVRIFEQLHPCRMSMKEILFQ